jgi:hypothetical protein
LDTRWFFVRVVGIWTAQGTTERLLVGVQTAALGDAAGKENHQARALGVLRSIGLGIQSYSQTSLNFRLRFCKGTGTDV